MAEEVVGRLQVMMAEEEIVVVEVVAREAVGTLVV
jgi:hypothetical protein